MDGARTELILFPFERRWYDRTTNANRRWERHLERETVYFLRRVADGEFGTAPMRWREQTARRLESAAEPIVIDHAGDEPDTDRVEARAVDAILKKVDLMGGERSPVKAQLVLFEEPGSYALLAPQGYVIVLDDGGTRANRHGSAERQLMVAANNLEPGMLLALPETSDRDLLDAGADALLENASVTRETAGLWKTRLRAFLEAQNESHHSFSKRMGRAGEPRDAATIRSWATDTRSIAPRNYRRVIPLLADLMGDLHLAARAAEVISAVERIYAARAKAAERLVEEIFSGEIDLAASHLHFRSPSGDASFGLHRIERCAGIREVPAELVGKAARIGSQFSEAAIRE
jgi:hypothetical protein